MDLYPLEEGLRDLRLLIAGAAMGHMLRSESATGVVASLIAFPLVYVVVAGLCRMFAASQPTP